MNSLNPFVDSYLDGINRRQWKLGSRAWLEEVGHRWYVSGEYTLDLVPSMLADFLEVSIFLSLRDMLFLPHSRTKAMEPDIVGWTLRNLEFNLTVLDVLSQCGNRTSYPVTQYCYFPCWLGYHPSQEGWKRTANFQMRWSEHGPGRS